jgi:hypothetical protein
MTQSIAPTIKEYNELQSGDAQEVCNILEVIINAELKEATSKIWHGGPVWFLEENPIVGYWVKKNGAVQLLFWSGQSFNEEELEVEGTFKAAQKLYTKATDIDQVALKRWLSKSRDIQWDYKDIVKRKGVLDRLK